MTQDPAARAADSSTSHAELYELVRTRPDLRPIIAQNPNTYPALLEWLGGLGDPSIDAALTRRRAPQGDQPTQVLHADNTSEFDQQVFGSAAGYSAPEQPAYTYSSPQTPAAVYDPEEDEAPRRRKGGAGVLVFLLALLTVGVLAATYFLLMGDPFGDDDAPEAGGSAAESTEDQGTDETAEEPDPSPEEDTEASPAPEDEAEDDGQENDDAELARPLPDDARGITEFSSPTGNISCELLDGDVLCTLAEYDFDTPEECENGVTFRVSEEGSATIDCSSSVPGHGQQLQYGEVTGNSDFACEANEMFFECWSQLTGEGFEVAREYYEFTGS